MAQRTRYAGHVRRKPDKAWVRGPGLTWNLPGGGKVKRGVDPATRLIGFEGLVGGLVVGWRASYLDAMFLVEDALR